MLSKNVPYYARHFRLKYKKLLTYIFAGDAQMKSMLRLTAKYPPVANVPNLQVPKTDGPVWEVMSKRLTNR